jgi:hypothetical protein
MKSGKYEKIGAGVDFGSRVRSCFHVFLLESVGWSQREVEGFIAIKMKLKVRESGFPLGWSDRADPIPGTRSAAKEFAWITKRREYWSLALPR